MHRMFGCPRIVCACMRTVEEELRRKRYSPKEQIINMTNLVPNETSVKKQAATASFRGGQFLLGNSSFSGPR